MKRKRVTSKQIIKRIVKKFAQALKRLAKK